MATAKKTPRGYWIQVKVGTGKASLRDSATLPSKREALDWHARRRQELLEQLGRATNPNHTLQEALRKYAQEVSPLNKGCRWELIRLAKFERDPNLPTTLPLAKLKPEHIAGWVDARGQQVKSSSVRREMSLLASVFAHAHRKWRWVSVNPLQGVEWPEAPPPSDVVISRAQIKGMLRALNYHRRRPQSMKEVVANMFLLALRTGMRSGEMEALQWRNVQPAYVTLVDSKNGDKRHVPIPKKARGVFARMQGWDEVRVFPITAQSRDSIWRRARDGSGLSGFTFHASRHTAATWVGRNVGKPGGLSFPEFCKVFGWRNPKQALAYVNPSAAELADRM